MSLGFNNSPDRIGVAAAGSPALVWLGEPLSRERGLVGGKASHLGALAAEFRVPSGFCLTALQEARLSGDGVPAALADEVAAAYRLLGERVERSDPSVAVRSSAVDEDSEGASWAGQFATYLNVVGIDAVLQAVSDCWQSAGSDEVTAYSLVHSNSDGAGRLAVLVQQLVPADVSAVVFSVNPLTANEQEVVINASWGLGESVVGGTVTPDTLVVDRDDLAVRRRTIGSKERMTILDGRGTREVAVPRILRSKPSLDDGQAAAMAELALQLEARMGRPVDVECAWAGGTLYLLQCRAITTLARRESVPGMSGDDPDVAS